MAFRFCPWCGAEMNPPRTSVCDKCKKEYDEKQGGKNG